MQIGQAANVKVRGADGKEADAPAPYVEFTLQSAAASTPAAGAPAAPAITSFVGATAGGQQ
jgi:hypothetical protein